MKQQRGINILTIWRTCNVSCYNSDNSYNSFHRTEDEEEKEVEEEKVVEEKEEEEVVEGDISLVVGEKKRRNFN